MGEAPSEAAGRGGSVSRANHRDGWPVEQIDIALRDQERRRIVDLGKKRGIKPPPEYQVTGTELLNLRPLALRFIDAA
jgi:hypothetical protein